MSYILKWNLKWTVRHSGLNNAPFLPLALLLGVCLAVLTGSAHLVFALKRHLTWANLNQTIQKMGRKEEGRISMSSMRETFSC